MARKRNVYTDVFVGDLSELVPLPPSTDSTNPLGDQLFDLILATDTYIYYGDLRSPLTDAASRLPPLGRIAISLERMTAEEDEATGGKGWRLQGSGTYVHTTQHVREAAAAAGLEVEHLDTRHSPRNENGKPVKGQMAILRLTS